MSKNESSSAAVVLIAVVLLGLTLLCLAGVGLVAFDYLLVAMRNPSPPVASGEPVDQESTVSRVSAIAAALMGVDPADVQPSTSLGELGADDLDVVELVMQLEDEFGTRMTFACQRFRQALTS